MKCPTRDSSELRACQRHFAAKTEAIRNSIDGIVYLATPYTHSDPAVVNERYREVNRVAGELIKAGFIVYSPISQSHSIAETVKLPTDWEYWKRVDTAFLEKSAALFVMIVEGWQTSVGVQAEIEIAGDMSIPIWAIDRELKIYETTWVQDEEMVFHLAINKVVDFPSE